MNLLATFPVNRYSHIDSSKNVHIYFHNATNKLKADSAKILHNTTKELLF